MYIRYRDIIYMPNPYIARTQWMLGDEVAPNQKIEMGKRKDPNIATGRRRSGARWSLVLRISGIVTLWL